MRLVDLWSRDFGQSGTIADQVVQAEKQAVIVHRKSLFWASQDLTGWLSATVQVGHSLAVWRNIRPKYGSMVPNDQPFDARLF
jgi:hypothetical protein